MNQQRPNIMRKPTQKEIEHYVNWILEESSTPHDEIEWLIAETNKDEVFEAVKTVNEILNDRE